MQHIPPLSCAITTPEQQAGGQRRIETSREIKMDRRAEYVLVYVARQRLMSAEGRRAATWFIAASEVAEAGRSGQLQLVEAELAL